jgi:hypothetical protein
VEKKVAPSAEKAKVVDVDGGGLVSTATAASAKPVTEENDALRELRYTAFSPSRVLMLFTRTAVGSNAIDSFWCVPMPLEAAMCPYS